LHFGDRQTDRQTDGQIDGHHRCVKPQSRYELRLDKAKIAATFLKTFGKQQPEITVIIAETRDEAVSPIAARVRGAKIG